MKKVYTGNWQLSKRLEFYSKSDEAGCLIWTGAKIKGGYGHLKVKGKVIDAHRLAWENANGAIPDGLFVCHKCDVRSCINPDHLFLGTHQDNTNDMVGKGRQNNGSKTVRGDNHGRSKLSYEKVFEMRWMAAMGRTHQSLADEYGVTQCTASDAISGRTWQFECHNYGH